MDNNELKLEQVVNEIENFEVPQAVPVFEIFVSLVAIAISMLLFLYTNFMHADVALYVLMDSIFPQYGWAILLSLGGIFGSLGLLVRSNMMRTVALIMLAGVYGLMAYCYILVFPSIGAIIMVAMAIFCIMSVPIVKYTGLGKTERQHRDLKMEQKIELRMGENKK